MKAQTRVKTMWGNNSGTILVVNGNKAKVILDHFRSEHPDARIQEAENLNRAAWYWLVELETELEEPVFEEWTTADGKAEAKKESAKGVQVIQQKRDSRKAEAIALHDTMQKTDLDHKIFMAQGVLDTARLHELTQNCVIGKSREEADKKKDDALIGKKLVTHFLYALVFEISIKIIHEIENGKEAPRHHKISLLYKDLSPAVRQKISELYDVQIFNMKKVISQSNGSRDRAGRIVNLKLDIQTLEDALEVNEQTVTNFKYDGKINKKSSVLCSMMWTDNLIYALPQLIADAIIFPKALLEYAISLKS